MSLTFTAQARADLKIIYRYGKSFWGIEKSRNFVRTLRSRCDMLLDHTRAGISQNKLGKNIHLLIIEGHRIVYHVGLSDRISILRVIPPHADATTF